MITEEMIEELQPVQVEIDYKGELEDLDLDGETAHQEAPAHGSETRSKKDQIIGLFNAGTTDIAKIVRLVAARPSYVAQVLQNEGLINGYFDLYTTTAREQNVY